MFRDVGARERTRTSTTVRPLAPEASASASSATRAQVRVHHDQVGVTPEMLTPAQPESHIQRSIFILPGSFPFVNATRVQCLAAPPDLEARRSYLPSAVHSPSTRRRTHSKICISLFILPLYPAAFGPRSSGQRTHPEASVLIILCTRIFNP